MERVFSENYIHSRIDKLKLKIAQLDELMALPPHRVEIQPTSFCNRNCEFCSHSIRNLSRNELSLERILELKRELFTMGCHRYSFSGGGEPFQWKSGELYNLITQNFFDSIVSITTNGDAFWDSVNNQPKYIDLMDFCSEIIINTPDTDSIRFKSIVNGNSSWETIKNVLQTMVDYREKSRSNCSIYCSVVVNKKNIDNLLSIDKRLSQIGIKNIYYKELKNYENNNLDSLCVQKKDLINKYEDYLSHGSESLKRFIDSLMTRECYKRGNACWINMIGQNAIIDPNGEVFLCTPFVGKNEYSIGNINNNSFAKLWKSNERKKVIYKLNNKYSHQECPSECRFLTHNEIINNYLFNTGTVYGDANSGIDSFIY